MEWNIGWWSIPPIDGKRQRQYYKTEDLADKAVDNYKRAVKRAGTWWTNLSDAMQMSIEVVVTQITAAGQTIGAVWEKFKEKTKEAAAIKNPTSYKACVTEWKRRKKEVGADAKYLEQAGVDLMKFAAGQEERFIHEFEAKELDTWIVTQRIKKPGVDFGKPWGLSTRRTWTSLFHSLWDCAIAIKAATENIVDSLEPIEQPKRIKRIYTIEQEKRLLAGGLETKSAKRHLITEVLGLFCCMRPDEISSQKPKRRKLPKDKWFGWHNINLKTGQITVSADVASEDDERVITLQPVAIEWLKLCKELECPLPPVGEFRLRGEICKMIGLTREEGIRDGFRKTCATHLRNLLKNNHDTGREMGHSATELIKSYALLKTPPEQSTEHWMLSPEVIEKYRKSREWKKVLRETSEKIKDSEAKDAEALATSASEATEVP
jgi:integrase